MSIILKYNKTTLHFDSFEEVKQVMSEDAFATLLYNIAILKNSEITFQDESMDFSSNLLSKIFKTLQEAK